MNTPTAIFGGLALIAAAIYFAGTGAPTFGIAHAQDGERDGTWTLRGHNEPLILWKLNTRDGTLYTCTYASKECTPVQIKK